MSIWRTLRIGPIRQGYRRIEWPPQNLSEKVVGKIFSRYQALSSRYLIDIRGYPALSIRYRMNIPFWISTDTRDGYTDNVNKVIQCRHRPTPNTG